MSNAWNVTDKDGNETGLVIYRDDLPTDFYEDNRQFADDLEDLIALRSRGAKDVRTHLLSAYRADLEMFDKLEEELNTQVRRITPEEEERLVVLIDRLFGTSSTYNNRIDLTEGSLLRVMRVAVSIIVRRLSISPDVVTPIVRQHILTYANEVKAYFGEGTRKALKDALRRFQRDGTISRVNFIDELRRKYVGREYIARTVGNTAVSNVIAEVSRSGYIAAPEVGFVRWVTVGDSRVRPTHRRNGQPGRNILPKGQSWSNGTYPGVEYNCRCAAEPLSPQQVSVQGGVYTFKPFDF